ncbi:dihydrolipoamide acetyltransferase family protein [Salarchaeum sp. JOR-1]|uniref:dihydrolipoamide acetyltransferase family protein n=1 Tax=Salarchaeum sp. JOR-1 TaxID=2599399 RepID=UPI001198B561|nr:dihydrolipoamide acetyltransferase family protein [Salarchaeum sp. JOR-1]QDX40091.1 2-oxo acid dehydrogenase subunit E2 [Salarchaeum sp. JOR-1]
MPTEFKLPDVGEGVAEGEIVAWLVSEGDTVEEDQPVAEVETDKAVVEVPSPYDGTVKELHYEEGDVVPVGDVIVTFNVEGEDDLDAAPERDETSAADADADTETADAASAASSGSGRTFAPPSVRRLARERDVDLSTVSGSGPSGRITEGDVRAAAESGEESAEASAPKSAVTKVSEEDEKSAASAATNEKAASAEPVEAAGREKTLAAPATRRVAEELGVSLDDVPASEEREDGAFVSEAAVREYAEAQQAAQAADTAEVRSGDADGESGEREERVPYRGVRRTIGKQMAESKYTAPHVTHHDTAVVDALADVREELKPVAEERGFRLTYMPFIVKAVVAGLKQHPYLNSQLDEENEEIVLKNYYNIGIAVATDAGLMVPVIKNVDEKSIPDIAAEMRDLIEKARDRSISREEMQGGTFTLTNFGAIGGEYATPIINYPETAILGLGALEERPVAEDGDVVAKETLPLSLSIDHRVIDGAVAAEFANTVQEYLENPSMLLLE